MTAPIPLGELPKTQGLGQIILVYQNRLLGRENTTVMADSEAVEGNMVVSNVLTEYRDDFYQTGSVFSRSLEPTPHIRMTFNLARPRDIEWLSYHWSNNRLPWRAELRRSGALKASTPWTNPIVKADFDDFDYDEFPFETGPNDEKLGALAFDNRLSSFYHLPRAYYGIDQVDFIFNCEGGANGQFDYIESALFMAARTFQPEFNVTTGIIQTPHSRSIVSRTAGGVADGVTRPTSNGLKFTLQDLTSEEGYQLFEDWIVQLGELARVFVYPYTGGPERRNFYSSSYIGTAAAFDGLLVDKEPGYLNGVYVSKTVKTIRIEGTE